MSQIKEVNALTGEEIERDMTEDELAENAKLIEKWEKEEEIRLRNKQAKDSILEKLGITEEEAKLLLS